MHFHICGDEFILIFQFYESIKVYAYHYKHIIWQWFGQRKTEHCEICDE